VIGVWNIAQKKRGEMRRYGYKARRTSEDVQYVGVVEEK
jgi:hypothetical protein